VGAGISSAVIATLAGAGVTVMVSLSSAGASSFALPSAVPVSVADEAAVAAVGVPSLAAGVGVEACLGMALG
jgi:hypothetical protein